MKNKSTETKMRVIPPRNIEKPKVLIVDDLEDNILALEKTLKPMREDMQIFKAKSGLEGLYLTKMHSFALVLLDVMMPNLDGFETATRIRQNKDTKSVPIIFLTAFSKDEKFIFEGYEHGAVDCLVKPISPLILLSKVKVFLELDMQKIKIEEVLKKLKINEEGLTQSKEFAERASNYKSQFLAQMSHELRTPLNAIIGMSQLLVKNKKNEHSAQTISDIDLIRRSGNHLLTLINEILDLSAIECGKFQLDNEPVAILNVLRESLSLIKPQSEKFNISIIEETKDAEGLYSMTDKIRLKQILINLLSNAVKYNVENGSVSLSCKRVKSNIIRISVTDTGPGISEENQAILFEPFRRFKNVDWQPEETGIGLSICKRLIESMNGKIDFSSVVGEGSCFFIELNICEPPSGNIAEPAEIRTVNINAALGVEKYQVLYIEDNPLNQEVLLKLLKERKDIDILTASLGRLGLELAQEHSPDLILLDIDLPDMNGFDVFRSLQELDETKNIPVVAISAHAMKDNIAKAKNMGFKEYLTKPIDVDLFFSTLNLHLKK